MNCPTCDALIPNECWTAEPPLPTHLPASSPARAAGRGPAAPHSTEHRITLWCEFCQAAVVVRIRLHELGEREVLRVQHLSYADDVRRLLKRLPSRGRDIRFVNHPRRKRRGLDVQARPLAGGTRREVKQETNRADAQTRPRLRPARPGPGELPDDDRRRPRGPAETLDGSGSRAPSRPGAG